MAGVDAAARGGEPQPKAEEPAPRRKSKKTQKKKETPDAFESARRLEATFTNTSTSLRYELECERFFLGSSSFEDRPEERPSAEERPPRDDEHYYVPTERLQPAPTSSCFRPDPKCSAAHFCI